ncbi:STAS domain-containing protein [Paenisporosarcina antarctica]|uniref:STAS domain-containing protein n=1 Tax=Paenisporosarcina antarctica TaxID=417367 RepID=A0A4P7A2C1_9BACL|nr:STAS domain-containing protein [Paenisporosarcina antarctica]QBP43032.1 STAS domain-containing protein [Paenisporosarcina antarctica]
MNEVGTIPNEISMLKALNSIGETIIIADKLFHIRWMNSNASELLTLIAPLFQLQDSHAFIGLSMDFFHQRPEHQQRVMGSLKTTLRTRITIRNRFVTDIVVTPIMNDLKEIEGYVIMLMDVTIKSEEEKKKEKLIKALSIPILHVWKNTIALPLIGEFDAERADLLISSVLMECSTQRIEYVIISLSGLSEFDQEVQFYIQKLYDCLKLIGAKCILVGISPKMAISMGSLERDIPTYRSTYAGLEAIIEQQKHI